MANIISTLGFSVPVLIGEQRYGAARVKAAEQLGLGSVPCVRVDHLSEAEQRVLRIAVNRVTEKGEWDIDQLKLEFEELIHLDAPLEASGFSPDQIDQIVLGEDLEMVEEGEVEPNGSIATARLGDIYALGPHRLICG